MQQHDSKPAFVKKAGFFILWGIKKSWVYCVIKIFSAGPDTIKDNCEKHGKLSQKIISEDYFNKKEGQSIRNVFLAWKDRLNNEEKTESEKKYTEI